MKKSDRGFTLIEVLIAMAVFAVASVSLFTIGQQNAANAIRLEQKTLAHWVAMNKMVEMQNLDNWPDLGKQDDKTEMAKQDWEIETEVENTPIETLRRVTVKVGMKSVETDDKTAWLTQLVGFVGKGKK